MSTSLGCAPWVLLSPQSLWLANMAADAVLNYVSRSIYPEDEARASATVSAAELPDLLGALRRAQGDAEDEIRRLSASSAADVDTWIARAEELRLDIQRSRVTARQIVADAEATEGHKAVVDDRQSKIALLEEEVQFNGELRQKLENVHQTDTFIRHAQEYAVQGDVKAALTRLNDAEANLVAWKNPQGSRAREILSTRADAVRRDLVEMTSGYWNTVFKVHANEGMFQVCESDSANTRCSVPMMDIEVAVTVAEELDILKALLTRLAGDLDRVIFRPCTTAGRSGIAQINIANGVLSCVNASDNAHPGTVFQGLRQALDYLADHIPPIVAVPLCSTLLPTVTSRLETQWLDSAIPSAVSELHGLQCLITDVRNLAGAIECHGWDGASPLREWIQAIPRIWLTKRRDAVLSEVRNMVSVGSRETKRVERVETRTVGETGLTVTRPEARPGQDDWDTAWDEKEPDSPNPRLRESQESDEDDDVVGAWGMGDDAGSEAQADAAGDEEAWGWDDEDGSKASPVATRRPAADMSVPETNGSSRPADHEMTLRESFTVTTVPDGVFAALESLVADAEALANDPELRTSPVAPAASALYTLPTLALAIYRATASTAYMKQDAGNMLIYNDVTHLASRLRDWQSSRLATSRLRLDKDVTALDAFAKRAYSGPSML